MTTITRLKDLGMHLMQHKIGIVMFPLLLEVSSLTAATIRVPQNQKTIQAGIDAAKPGDTILVNAGTYKEHIHLKSGITLKSN
jgi:hypothetical protein